MLLIGMALVGGALAAERQVRRTRKKQRKSLVTKLLVDLGSVPAQMSRQKHPIGATKQNNRTSFLHSRQQQLSEISETGEIVPVSDAEKEMDRYLAISVASLGLTTVGSWLFPPLALLSVPGLVYLSGFFFKRSYNLIREKGQVSVALVDCLSFGGTLLTGHYFACSLTYTFFYLSRKLLIKTEDHSKKSLQDVFGQKPNFVWIQQGDVEVEIPFEQLQLGDILVIQAGQTIPIDGAISSGSASIDQRALTGESQPVEKEQGEQVFASTLVLSGKIHVAVEKTGEDTVAAQIGDILHSTADFKSNIVSRGEKIIGRGATPTLLLSLLALPLGINSALAMLYTAFGYHMRSAAPISVLNFLNMASQNGILIKDGRSLELLSEVDTFVFDKTGTLTQDEPHVGTIHTCGPYDEQVLLAYAAAAEHKQTHPIALAIQKEAEVREMALPPIGEITVELGYGLKVEVLATQEIQAALVCVGSSRFMDREQIIVPDGYQAIEERAYENGHSLVYVAINHQFAGAIELVPTIRPEAKAIIDDLHRRDIQVVIISGDHEKPTKKLAAELGIDQYFAQTLPQNKADIVGQLQAEGRSVCFVGDGINDSIALKKANVSISLRGASTVATDTASIVLMDASLKQIVSLLNLAADLDTNLDNSTALTVLPGILCAGGVFFLHLGLLSSLIWCNVALIASLGNAMMPLFKYKREQRQLASLQTTYTELEMNAL